MLNEISLLRRHIRWQMTNQLSLAFQVMKKCQYCEQLKLIRYISEHKDI